MTLAQRLKISSDRNLAAARADGQRSLLVSLLEQKFGKLDEVSAARVAKASPAKVAKWALRVLTAKSIDEIWA